jgi:hypothetical protein
MRMETGKETDFARERRLNRVEHERLLTRLDPRLDDDPSSGRVTCKPRCLSSSLLLLFFKVPHLARMECHQRPPLQFSARTARMIGCEAGKFGPLILLLLQPFFSSNLPSGLLCYNCFLSSHFLTCAAAHRLFSHPSRIPLRVGDISALS